MKTQANRKLAVLGEGYQKWMPPRIHLQAIKAFVLTIGNDAKLMLGLNEMLEQIKQGNTDERTALIHCIDREIPVVVKVNGGYTSDYTQRRYFLRRDEIGLILYDTKVRYDVSCLYMPTSYSKAYIELDLDFDYRQFGHECAQPC